MPLFTVYVTHRDLGVWEVEAVDAEEARQRYRTSGVRVSIENGDDEVTEVDQTSQP